MEFASAPSCWIFGYGSLMSIKSATNTMKSARNFTPGYLHNYQRIFSLVGLFAISRDRNSLMTKELAAVSIFPRDGSQVCGIFFEIDIEEFAAYVEREHPYKLEQVFVVATAEHAHRFAGGHCRCWTVSSRTDKEYLASMSSEGEWHSRVGQFYEGSLWDRKDIIPSRFYLLFVLKAAWELRGEEWVKNLLDDCLLADGSTIMRDFILTSYQTEGNLYYADMNRELPAELVQFIVGNKLSITQPSDSALLSSVSSSLSNGKNVLHEAVLAIDVSRVQTLMSSNPELSEQVDSTGNTPFHYACYRNSIECLQVMLNFNSNSRSVLLKRTIRGESALDFACMYGHYDIVRALVPEYTLDINSADETGWTVLHSACNKTRPRTLDIVDWLIRHGANPALHNIDGQTAADLTSDSRLLQLLRTASS